MTSSYSSSSVRTLTRAQPHTTHRFTLFLLLNVYCLFFSPSLLFIIPFSTQITLLWNAPQGCPVSSSSGGISFGSVMLIIIVILVALYFIAGCPIMYFVFHKRGIEIIPFVFFWASLPTLVVEGVKFLISPCLSSVGQSSYQTFK